MKLLSETYKELGIAFSYPIQIKDDNRNETYYEVSNGFWHRYERDANGNETYFEDSDGYWAKWERDDNGNETYYEDSDGDWAKWERDDNGNEAYYENSDGVKRGTPKSAKTFEGKVIEVDGIKYKLKAL
jgi:hypothetical protein